MHTKAAVRLSMHVCLSVLSFLSRLTYDLVIFNNIIGVSIDLGLDEIVT